MSDNKKRLVFSILEFLQQSVNDGTIKADDVEGIEVAMQCIGEAFGVDAQDETQRAMYTTKPATLTSIFDVFIKTQNRMSSKQVCGDCVLLIVALLCIKISTTCRLAQHPNHKCQVCRSSLLLIG
ncbi:hypothetical protein K493DRAFT_231659 [Basidiobolus meristosporus CBS 931.73]|uniref:SGTA homodimerisation domain-containing protein n=1 Tax=Basidiobolus meristosporus CBS 931.73 TaxID=1314790 RepID=A0A1Y1XWB7_9FUNG|nr:hypothetical protein K493DRAFT_231659 [Basidiobolus meristosporus CBS 931.73]|eukprot:ORX90051.1 hypothetical protein K493DRAFT_231659 [Basidiobolus meristosporus CBS 931.73]